MNNEIKDFTAKEFNEKPIRKWIKLICLHKFPNYFSLPQNELIE